MAPLKILFVGAEEVGKRTIINLLLGLKTFPGNGPITFNKTGNFGGHTNIELYSLTPNIINDKTQAEDLSGTSLIVAVVTKINNCISAKKALDKLGAMRPDIPTCVIANKQDGEGMDPTAASKLFNLATIGICGMELGHQQALIDFLNEFL